MTQIPWSVILDKQRLNELQSLNIIDTKPEQSYDDLSELARLICEAPVANVTLVSDNRQWFKSYVGNDVQETPISQSICAHALDKPEYLVINDLTNDIRTTENALVTGEASLRFYAGVPLRLESRFGVGTLCVLDTKPHPNGLSAAQATALKALGRQATILLHIRRHLAENANYYEEALATESLDKISDHLVAAYEINKGYSDEVLEKMIRSSLMYVAAQLTRGVAAGKFLIH